MDRMNATTSTSQKRKKGKNRSKISKLEHHMPVILLCVIVSSSLSISISSSFYASTISSVVESKKIEGNSIHQISNRNLYRQQTIPSSPSLSSSSSASQFVDTSSGLSRRRKSSIEAFRIQSSDNSNHHNNGQGNDRQEKEQEQGEGGEAEQIDNPGIDPGLLGNLNQESKHTSQVLFVHNNYDNNNHGNYIPHIMSRHDIKPPLSAVSNNKNDRPRVYDGGFLINDEETNDELDDESTFLKQIGSTMSMSPSVEPTSTPTIVETGFSESPSVVVVTVPPSSSSPVDTPPSPQPEPTSPTTSPTIPTSPTSLMPSAQPTVTESNLLPPPAMPERTLAPTIAYTFEPGEESLPPSRAHDYKYSYSWFFQSRRRGSFRTTWYTTARMLTITLATTILSQFL